MSKQEDDVAAYRIHVGMRRGYDFMGGLQFSLLISLGLRETTTFCDVGCGSLRVGRLLIPFLLPDHYCGIEPQRWLVEAGIEHEVGSDIIAKRAPRFDYGEDFGIARFGQKFDMVLAQSIFSHTYRDMTADGLRKIADGLAPGGLFVGTIIERFPILLPQGDRGGPDDGSGWRATGSGVVYTWRGWQQLLTAAGLVGTRIRWYHQRQTWFIAVRTEDRARLAEIKRAQKYRLRGVGFAGNAKRRALDRFRR